MKKGAKVNVNLSFKKAQELGISDAIHSTGVIIHLYYEGCMVFVDGRTLAIPERYNALELITKESDL